ncbi:MAG TPA: sugar phosphate isomerase/epimerase family protein [Terriglobia bacterium]|nr:sugar phosphate isomerase/epimerase family protein [Terriglobia bacterium]
METKSINRREFVGASLAATAGLLASAGTGTSQPARSENAPGLKVGLYTITYLGVWYRGDALSLEDAIRRAKSYGYDGIEVDGKRPHGHPLSLTRAHARELRQRAEDEGIEIYGLAGNNDFSSPITEQRDAQLNYMRDLIGLAPELGAKTVRVFLAWPGVTEKQGLASYDLSHPLWDTVHQGYPPEETWDWCRNGMIECARYAADAGVTLALQNHKPVIKNHLDVLRMVKEVNSPQLKVSLDAWIMDDKSPAAIRQAALDVGSLQALSHFGGEFKREADGSVKGPEPDYYASFVRAMYEIGYQGYIGYELCHTLPVVNGQTVGLEFADQCAEAAAVYMRGLIKANES